MLPRRLRLSRRDFESIGTASGLMRAQSPHFSVSYGTADDGHGGAAVVVSKKVDTSSVKRHIVKRRVREALREFARQDQVLIVYVRPGSVSLTFQEIQAELGELIRRSGA